MRRGKAAVLLLVGALGCQRDRDRTMESMVERAIKSQGRESKVIIDREHASITVDVGGVTMPEGWPAAVPFYPRANHAKIETLSGDVRRLRLTSDDSSAAMADFYSRELARLGWQIVSPSTPGVADPLPSAPETEVNLYLHGAFVATECRSPTEGRALVAALAALERLGVRQELFLYQQRDQIRIVARGATICSRSSAGIGVARLRAHRDRLDSEAFQGLRNYCHVRDADDVFQLRTGDERGVVGTNPRALLVLSALGTPPFRCGPLPGRHDNSSSYRARSNRTMRQANL